MKVFSTELQRIKLQEILNFAYFLFILFPEAMDNVKTI